MLTHLLLSNFFNETFQRRLKEGGMQLAIRNGLTVLTMYEDAIVQLVIERYRFGVPVRNVVDSGILGYRGNRNKILTAG